MDNRARALSALYGALLGSFVTGKVAGVISWSWWWVLSPLWMPAAATLAFMALLACVAIAALLFLPDERGSR